MVLIVQLNLSTDIALRTLMYLAKNSGMVTIKQVAEEFNLSKTHLMKVVMTLVAAGYIVSERGRTGGIYLAHDARMISVGAVVRLMEHNLALLECMKEGATKEVCTLLPVCRLKKVFHQAQMQFLDVLDQKTLADIL